MDISYVLIFDILVKYLNLGAASNLLWGSLCMVSKYSGAVCNQEWVIIARVRYILKLGSGVISFMGFLCFPNGHDIQLLIYRSNQESGNLKYKQDFDAMLYCVPIITCSPDIVTNSALRVVQIFRNSLFFFIRIIVLKKITNNKQTNMYLNSPIPQSTIFFYS